MWLSKDLSMAMRMIVGVSMAMLVDAASLFLENSNIRNSSAVFHLDRFREKNVVFKMDVLVKVFLEAFECREERLVGNACVRRNRKVVC